MTTTVTTADGRSLALYEGGDPSGAPVIYQHGTPSSGLLYGKHDALAREQGIRLVGYDRPGYGGSTRHAGRSIGDCAADVGAIAEALGFERYATWGISGGGPHALACAALCDERLAAAACLAGVAPWGAEGLDWLAGMGEANVKEFDAILAGEEALRPVVERDAAEMLAATPGDVIAVFESLLGPADRAVLTGALAEFFVEGAHSALDPGIDGWIDDDLSLVAPWGFELAAIDRPVLLLHGDDDRFVPVSHGHWLAARVPGVEARIDASDGHLTLYEHRVAEVHEWLLGRI